MTRYSIRGEFEEICHHWGWFLALGLVLMLLGVIALGAVWLSTLATVLLFGWLLIAAGAFEMYAAFWSQQWSGVFLHLLAGILHLVVGILLVGRPGASAAALTMLIAALFLAGGLFRIVAALMVRHAAWGWAALDGAVGVILGLLIWAEWPASALWVIGMFVGIALLIRGWAWVMFALAARHIAHGLDIFGHPQSA
jgi:uncharacterized membrane protein HdeD (DUF308 family)